MSPRDPLAASLIKPLSAAGGWPPPYLGVHHEGEENEGEEWKVGEKKVEKGEEKYVEGVLRRRRA